MTRRSPWLIGLLAVSLHATPAGASPSPDAPPTTDRPRVTLEWQESSSYSDARAPTTNQDRFDLSLRASFRSIFEDQARKFLPAGATLEVAIDDLDLAGEIAFSPAVARARSYSRLLPPRMVVSYELRDGAGELLASGKGEELVGRADRIPRRYRSDPFPYERALIEDWFRRELASAAGS